MADYTLSLKLEFIEPDDYLRKRLKILHKVNDVWTVSQVLDVAKQKAPTYKGTEDPRRLRLELRNKIHVNKRTQPESGLPYNVLTVSPDVDRVVRSLHFGWRLPERVPKKGKILKFPLQKGQKLYRPGRGISPEVKKKALSTEKTWVAAKKVKGKLIGPKNQFIPLAYMYCWNDFKRMADRALKTRTVGKLKRKQISRRFRIRRLV